MQLTYPGVYREEIAQRQRTVEQLNTSIFAITGQFERGPVEDPQLVSSPAEFERIFGSVNAKSSAATQVLAFFLNGGGQAYINRVLGDGATKAAASFSNEVQGESVSIATGGGATSNIVYTPSLADLPIKPGSAVLKLDEQVDVAAENLGSFLTGVTSITGTIGSRVILPGSVTLSINGNDYTDDGSGVINDFNPAPVGSIDYQTGVLSFTSPALSADDDLLAAYTYYPSTRVQGEVIAEAVANQRVYRGKLANTDPIGDANNAFVRITWTDTANASKVATVNALGAITGDGTGTLGADGVFSLNVGSTGVKDGTNVTISYWYKTYAFKSVDNGLGSLTGALGTFTIDYETGDISGTTVATDAVGAAITLDYEYVLAPLETRYPGLSSNDVRAQLVVNENDVSSATGKHGSFELLILEERFSDGAFALVDTIGNINLEDSLSRDYYPTRVNDTYLGSTLAAAKLDYTEKAPNKLNGAALTGEVVDVGDGSVRAIAGTLYAYGGRGIIPGTVVISYVSGGTTITVTDDGLGSIVGDDIDGSAPATIDYDTGSILFTPSSAPDALSDVEASYTRLSELTSLTEDFSGGTDGAAVTRSNIISPLLLSQDRGIYAFNKINEILILAAADFPGDAQVDQALLAYAESREDSMVILTSPEGSTVQRAISYKRNVLASNSARGAMYHSWIKIEDPLTGRAVDIPPFGHIAGVWARTDRNRNVGKAPAGTTDGVLTFILGFTSDLTEVQVGQLKAAGINSLWKPSTVEPRCVWGARTLDVSGEFRFINKRRTVDFVSVSVQRSAWWVVFEDNDASTRNLIRNQISGFLRGLWNDRVLKGDTANDAFFVVCDSKNNPNAVQAGGQFIVDYGVKTRDTVEFVKLRHSQIV